MTIDSVAALNTMMAQLSARTTFTPAPWTAAPMISPIINIDWRAEFYDVLRNGPWRAVNEYDGKGEVHDHTPMPPADMITSAQVSLIRLPEKTVKAARKSTIASPFTHKLCLELWTVPHAQIVRHRSKTQWRRFVQLRSDNGFEKASSKMVAAKCPISTEFRDYALGIVYGGPGGTKGMQDLFGVPHDSNHGWHYYDEHLAKIAMDDAEQPVLEMYRNRELAFTIDLGREYAGYQFPDGGVITHVGRKDF